MSGYKVARLVDLLAQMGGPVTAAQLLARYRDTYGKSAMMGFNNTNAVTQQLMPIVNPETIRVDKSRTPFTFEYLGGTTIGDWLKPSMRAKYESVSFKAESPLESFSEYAPTERIIRRLKHSGVWGLGTDYSEDSERLLYKWWATVKIEDGTLVRATQDEQDEHDDSDLTLINIILIDGEDADGYGRVTVSYTDVDNAYWEESYQDQMAQLGKELTIIFENNGMFQSGDDLEYGDMGEFYNVHWGDLVSHSCADNAKFDIYEDDEIIMECMVCGRTATFRQETPYQGPRKRINAETFGAEELEISVGDRVRSYDFILPDGTLIRDDCYMEGRVTKIAPVDWCGSECDHYYILVDRVVRNGEEIDSKTLRGRMVFPPVSESYLEVGFDTKGASTFNAESEAETDEYKGPFEVEIRRPNGAVATWKKYDNYGKLIEALEEIVSKRYTPYAIDVFATNVPYISGFTAMGPVTDYRKFHLATWKYGNWESGPWAKHFPTGLE
ncbi:hypothetical protein N9M03_00665 [bacterium]|nr:hypothetical protein [bacterium]